MDTLTLFRAYQRAVSNKSVMVANRSKSNWGIAVESDEHARRWQRADRQARKLERKIVQRLGGKLRIPDNYLCLISGYPICSCNCRQHQGKAEVEQ